MKALLFLTLIAITFAQFDYFSLQPYVFPWVDGWYNDAPVKYYNFFTNSSYIASTGEVANIPLYSLVTGFDSSGNAIPVVGQHNIADTILGQLGYSDLWGIQYVTVPSSYVANTIMDVNTLLQPSNNFTVTKGPFVNCPMVPIGSSLQGGEKNITLGWYQNMTINYIDFGPNSQDTIPIYVFPNVTGQYNIIPAVPGSNGYSAFWNAQLYTAPSGYVPNTYRSVSEVNTASLLSSAGPNGINCPVIWVGNSTSSSSSSSSSSSNGSSVLIVSFFSMVMYLLF